MRLPLIFGIFLLAGCTGPTSDGTELTRSASPGGRESTPPSSTLRPASDQPIREDTLTGILGADSIEGGCAYLETADGTRYEVIYPRGWDVTVSPLQLTNPDGQIVARGGDEVSVRGSETTERASTCQIGPIFQATSVES